MLTAKQLMTDITFWLTFATVASGFISLIYWLFLRHHKPRYKITAMIIEHARSLFPTLLLVLLLRSFLIQPYRVPTGSLEPTVLAGDFILVNQYAYGLRLPVLNTKILGIGTPQRGEIALFRYPVDNSIIFVKRVIGLPGDHISYRNKKLIINGQVAQQEPWTGENISDDLSPYSIGEVRLEHLDQKPHRIIVSNDYDNSWGDFDLVVPSDHYFVMGDNRDNSSDSRTWGYVPEDHLIGRAFRVWLSWDKLSKRIRWQRIGQKVE